MNLQQVNKEERLSKFSFSSFNSPVSQLQNIKIDVQKASSSSDASYKFTSSDDESLWASNVELQAVGMLSSSNKNNEKMREEYKSTLVNKLNCMERENVGKKKPVNDNLLMEDFMFVESSHSKAQQLKMNELKQNFHKNIEKLLT